jgi:hypothetical protein
MSNLESSEFDDHSDKSPSCPQESGEANEPIELSFADMGAGPDEEIDDSSPDCMRPLEDGSLDPMAPSDYLDNDGEAESIAGPGTDEVVENVPFLPFRRDFDGLQPEVTPQERATVAYEFGGLVYEARDEARSAQVGDAGNTYVCNGKVQIRIDSTSDAIDCQEIRDGVFTREKSTYVLSGGVVRRLDRRATTSEAQEVYDASEMGHIGERYHQVGETIAGLLRTVEVANQFLADVKEDLHARDPRDALRILSEAEDSMQRATALQEAIKSALESFESSDRDGLDNLSMEMDFGVNFQPISMDELSGLRELVGEVITSEAQDCLSNPEKYRLPSVAEIEDFSTVVSDLIQNRGSEILSLDNNAGNFSIAASSDMTPRELTGGGQNWPVEEASIAHLRLIRDRGMPGDLFVLHNGLTGSVRVVAAAGHSSAAYNEVIAGQLVELTDAIRGSLIGEPVSIDPSHGAGIFRLFARAISDPEPV